MNKKIILNPNKVTKVTKKNKSQYTVCFDIEDIFLSFRFIASDIINISYYKGKLIKNDLVEIFESELTNNTDLNLMENEYRYIISSSILSIKIYKNPFYFEIKHSDDTILKQSIEDKDNVGNRLSNLFKFTKEVEKIISIKDSFYINSTEKFYGFGEKFSPLNKRGYNLVAWNEDAYGDNSEKSYKNIPFFLNSQGYGILINTTSKIKYDLATISYNSYSIEVEDSIFDFYFIFGPDFKKIISKYSVLTGKLEYVPPKWSFGLMLSKYGYKTRAEIENVANTLREKDIPMDVIWHGDPFWLRDGHYVDFVIDEKKYPNPKEMIEVLNKKGFKVGSWIQPTVSIKTEMFKEGKQKRYFLKDKNGDIYLWNNPLPKEPDVEYVDFSKLGLDIANTEMQPQAGIVDLSNPLAVSWFLNGIKKIIELGVSTMIVDFGEIVPEDSYFSNGKTGKEMHNYFAYLWSSSVYNYLRQAGIEKPVMDTRAGWLGCHKFPVCFPGDPTTTYEGMRNVLRGGLSAALSGYIFWGDCLGGLAPVPPTPDLFIRWVQYGMFTSHPKLLASFPNEPWQFGKEAEKIFKKYAKLRYKLIPYIYSIAHECVKKSVPFIRPLVLEYQDDPVAQEIDDEFLFGTNFLVAPIFNKGTSRNVYLPNGIWIDYWNKKIFEGKKYYKYKAGLDVLPLFVKSGAIIPMQEDVLFIESKLLDKLIIDLYPTTFLSNFRYIDDFEEVNINCLVVKDKITINIDKINKDFEIVINNYKDEKVEVNGRPIKKDSIKIDKIKDIVTINLNKDFNI
ncbi:MAG: TIM-barrel domain-containing protein [Candidatus Humimicrobiaceae bacterium]